MNKKIFSLLLVIFVLISLSAVSATELNDDKSIIYSSDDNAILSVDAKTFSDLSNDINGKDSITLESDYQYNESDEAALNNGYIDITKDITIDGNENGIYPTSSGKLFNISENVSVTIKNTIITGDGNSPLILLNNNSAVYLNNCKLINNKYEKSPFIGLDDEIGSMTIENSDIINNTVYTLFLSKVMTINSNRIINNTMDGFESTQEIVVNDNVFLANQDLYSNAREKLIMEGDYWGTNDAQSVMKEYPIIVPHRFAFTHASLNIDYPEIKYIIRVLKRYFYYKKMNSSFFGGLSSYNLFLLLLSYAKYIRISQNADIDQIFKDDKDKNKVNLGYFLFHFLYFFNYLNFKQYVIDINSENIYDVVKPEKAKELNFGKSIVIIDPLTGVNASKSSYKIDEIQGTFSEALDFFQKEERNYDKEGKTKVSKNNNKNNDNILMGLPINNKSDSHGGGGGNIIEKFLGK